MVEKPAQPADCFERSCCRLPTPKARSSMKVRKHLWSVPMVRHKDGLAELEEVNFDNLPTRVVVLTAAEDDRDVVRAMRLGARGVVLKQSATDLLVQSIHRVHAGEIWLDNRMTAEVMKAFSHSSESGQRREKTLLTDREREIVQHVAQGFRNKEIGQKLFISEQTVKNHLHNIFDKLGLSDRLELALYAVHHRLVDQR
jgi:two-component system, NarL family, nitrate/nitrite response regulator NarL